MKRHDILAKICEANSFQIESISPLGEGGSGFVYRVDGPDNQYAVKVLNEPRNLQRFLREIRVSGENLDAGTVPIVASGTIEEYCYYVMPLLVPTDKYKFQNFGEIASVCLAVSENLAKLASRGIFHRDIKPSNIAIDPAGKSVYLIDLGLVQETFAASDITQATDRIGSLTFIAPERIRPRTNAEIDSEKSDVYSYGMTIWALFTDERFGFSGQYRSDEHGVSFRSRNVDFRGSSTIEQVMEKCTAIDPNSRPLFQEVYQSLRSSAPNNWHISDFSWATSSATRVAKPNFSIWHETADIGKVLSSMISRKYPLEMLVHDDGGWLNLDGVKISEAYPDMLEIFANSDIHAPMLIEPDYLISCDDDEVPFLILQSKSLTPFKKSLPLDDQLSWMQPVCQLRENRFTYEACFSYDDFNGVSLPKGAKTYQLVTNGRFLIQLLGEHHPQLETVWEHHPEVLRVRVPFLQKPRNAKSRRRMRFLEPEKFRSRKRLLNVAEETALQELIEFIKATPPGPSEDFEPKYLYDFLENNPLAEFILIATEIAQYTVDNYNFLPIYEDLNYALSHFNVRNKSQEFHILRHLHQRKIGLLRKLYYFLYKYAENQQKYYEKFRLTLIST